MKALYIVIALVFTSLLMFFIGKSPIAPEQIDFDNRITNPDSFFYVFTIIFPAFTGLAAGLGLSGDLKNPKKSIPRGTIWATVVGILIYVFVAYKFTISASPEDLASDQLIMSKIAIWGPIIPIGLAAASISSALGSIMIAPRTLQAIGVDEISPNKTINKWLARGKLHSNEPVNATIISVIIAFFFVIIGDINFVARIISMFFMITYGSICTISFLEHFVADPSYRPTFKTKWYFSLLGAVFSLWLMFKMNLPYAIISILIISIIYYFVSTSGKESRGFVNLFRGVFFQLSKQIQVFLQQAAKEDDNLNWRPFMICISRDSFKRRSAFDIIRWISYKYGFGTYIHFIEGYLNNKTSNESKKILNRLINLASGARSKVYLDTIISPSYTSAIAQVIQLQSISGKGNNMILFEFSRTEPGKLNEALQNIGLLKTTEMDICILNSSYKSFGYKKEIHLWISSQDYENANLMILLAYILLGHPEWNKGIIKIFAIHKKAKLESQKEKIMSLIKSGRLPISPNNLILVPNDNIEKTKNIISEKSMDADLTIIGFRTESISKGIDLFTGYLDIGNILFVSSNKQKEIK
ncbi:amino acid permease [Bacteroidota bacterium]